MIFMLWNLHLETGIGSVEQLVAVEYQTGVRLKVHAQRKSVPPTINVKEGVP